MKARVKRDWPADRLEPLVHGKRRRLSVPKSMILDERDYAMLRALAERLGVRRVMGGRAAPSAMALVWALCDGRIGLVRMDDGQGKVVTAAQIGRGEEDPRCPGEWD